jgi:hypothetical protein
MVMRFLSSVFAVLGAVSFVLGAVSFVLGAPAALPASELAKRQTTQLSASQLSSYAPYTELARAAYCAPTSITKWTCGEACSAVLGFNVTLTGGDGNGVQYCKSFVLE